MEGSVYTGGAFTPARDATVSVFDHGLLYGDGVFEGIRAYAGRVFKLERHVARLFESARAIRLEIGQSQEAICQLVVETCRRNAIVDGYVRLVVTRGVGNLGIDPSSCPQPGVIVIARPVAPLYGAARRLGIRVVTSALRRPAPDALSPSIKSLNYLNNVLARLEVNDAGADEALMLDHEGYVAEATADNVFIVTERGLATPPTATNLRGITRETVIELAEQLGFRVEERRFALFDVWTAREVFLCGTMAEVVPVAVVDGRAIGAGAPGPVTQRLADAYDRLVRSAGTPIPAAPSKTATLPAP